MNAAIASVVLLDLAADQADEVVGCARRPAERRGALERGQRRVGVAEALLQQAQVVPRRARSASSAFTAASSSCLRGVVALQRESAMAWFTVATASVGSARGRRSGTTSGPLELLLVHAATPRLFRRTASAGAADYRRREARLRHARRTSDGGEEQKRRETDVA